LKQGAFVRNKILLIDDEVELVQVLRSLLETEGYQLETAHNGLQGLEKLKTFTPDLIILDMDMPKMGGIAFYHEIANLRDGTCKYPVLVFTGRANLENLFEDFRVDGFMSKPFEFDALQAKIREIFLNRYPENRPSTQAAAPKPERTRPRKILVFDTDRDHFDCLVLSFMNAGYDILSGFGGSEALNLETENKACRRVKLESPDAVLVKIDTPNPLSKEWMLVGKLLEITQPVNIPLILYGGEDVAAEENLAKRLRETPGVGKLIPSTDAQTILKETAALLRDMRNS